MKALLVAAVFSLPVLVIVLLGGQNALFSVLASMGWTLSGLLCFRGLQLVRRLDEQRNSNIELMRQLERESLERTVQHRQRKAPEEP